jgi:DNA-directed RNA polymerase subunit RPC12/RpoP
MIVVCQICNQEIARTADNLDLPLTGDMFVAHRTGFPPPFFPVEWEWIRCRYCGKRPFLKKYEFLTTDGIYRIDETTEDGQFVICQACGKQYKNSRDGLIWYEKHIEGCNG